MRARRLTLLLMIAASSVVVTACSSSPSASSSSSSTSTTANPFTAPTTPSLTSQHVCSLVTPADIESALGATVRPVIATTHGSITTCNFLASDRTASVSLHADTDASAKSFAASRALFATDGQTTTPIAGLGDQAFGASTTSGPTTVSSVVVLKGSNLLSVTAKAPLAQVETLATQLVAKL